MDKEIKGKVAFVGSGMIGSGLAVNALMHGYSVTLQTRRQVEKMKNRVAHIFDVMVENGILSREEADRFAARATYTTSIEEAASGACFVQESGPENLEIRRDLISQIEGFVGDDVVIASSTSKQIPSDIQVGMKHPERLIVGHPFHPSYLLPLVEICAGQATSASSVEKAEAFYRDIGKYPIVCHTEISGFIGNRLSWAIYGEAKKLVMDGTCSVEDVDKALMYGPGLRTALTGQILTISLGVEGGTRNQAAKYNRPQTEEDIVLADGIDIEIANRPEEIGNNVEGVEDFRDKAIIEILKMQKML